MGVHDRRDVLKGIGAGTVGLVAGGAGLATAQNGGDAGVEPARVRVTHASPDAPNVNVHVDGETAFEDVAFGDATDYLELVAGQYRVAITAAEDRDTVVFEGDVSVEAGTDYTIAALGELTEDTFRPHLLVDDTRPPVSGISYLRVVHASPDAPAVDVTLFDGQFTLFGDLSFRQATEYRAFPAGTFPTAIRPAGGGEAVAEVELTLQSETAYTVFANGYLTPDDKPTDEQFRLVATVDGENQASPTGRVRVAHASPDAPDVDVYVAGKRVLSGVPFGAVSQYLEIPAGTATLTITAAGDPDTVAFEGEVTIDADTDYTVAALGELTAETFTPHVYVDDNSVEQGRARLRIIHASPDAPAVDVTVDDAGTTLVDGLSFRSASDYLSLQPGQPTVEVRPDTADNDNPFDAEFDLQLRPGRVYTTFANGYFTTDDEPADEQFTLVTTTDA
jgi:hypothetical protein